MPVRSLHSLRRALAVLALASVLAPAPAWAGAQTLKRSVGNMLLAPVDLALSPITAGIVEYRNLSNSNDTWGVRIAYTVPGYFWLVGLHGGASVLRCLSGVLEFFPGLGLVFTDAELEPIFAPADRGEGVILDQATPVMDLKIGIDYTAAPF